MGVTVKCDYCGKKLERISSTLERNEHNFCCREHFHKWQSDKHTVEVKCDNCGKKFERNKSNYEQSNRHFCCRECYREFTRGEHHPRYNSKVVECDQCGKAFERNPYAINHYEHNFCSNECYHEFQRENKIEGEFECEYCGKTFESPSALGGHMNIAHKNPEIRKKTKSKEAKSKRIKSFKRTIDKKGKIAGTRLWTEEEKKIIRKHYPKAKKEKIKKLLPDRTWKAIRGKASELGVKRLIVEREYTPPPTAYKEGHTPWNKGKELPEETKAKLREKRLEQNIPKERTSIERKMESLLEELGVDYQRQYPIKGVCVADFAILEDRIALFADGCWFHCCPRHYPNPESETQRHNVMNDKKVNKKLEEKGWEVVRFFGCEIREKSQMVKEKIKGCLK